MQKLSITVEEPLVVPAMAVLNGIRGSVELWTGFDTLEMYSGSSARRTALYVNLSRMANPDAVEPEPVF